MFIKGRAATYISLSVLLLSFITIIIAFIVGSGRQAMYESMNPHKISINGKYSIDGGEWKDTIPDEMLHTRFHTVTVKGYLSREVYSNQQLVIFSENINYKLESNGITIENNPGSDEKGGFKSPGNNIIDVPVIQVFDGDPSQTELKLTMIYPYTMFSNADLSDFFQMYVTESGGVYEIFFEGKLFMILFCLMICFFGLLAFPIAGSVIGGINVRYLAFSALCFFTGFHLLVQVLSPFLPLWIDNPVLCMSISETTSHLFGICALIFIKVLLVDEKHKIIGNTILLAFSALIIALFVLSLTGVCDLYASNPYAQIFFAVCASILTVCMFRELKTNRDARHAIFTLIPLAGALLFDTINMYICFSDVMVLEFGAAITLIYQIVVLLYDLRQQYKETLRYQQMQRELVESRVAIMVSQIQPHFLYNSLTSIAMMCTIDPETAQEATVTFADYLRGNMDSLKQKEPVPFSKELEHLKKYLYIEKLRFGKKLNVVYDIQTESFVLPQLSVQPLAENAVKHGISKKRGGGTLTISTRETDDSFKVIVSDDGKGFDVNEVKNDGRSHVGMDNVRRRLKEMCGGEVEIESKIGEGTVATVTLPKEGQKRENTVC